MRIAIISDIHSNLEALQKALELIEKKRVDQIVCLGDLVGYGANPNECIELTRKHTSHILLGNHDQAAFDLSQTEHFNRHARTAAYWTNQTLTEANLEFLKTLPLDYTIDDLTFIHASPKDPQEWNYIFSAFEARANFEFFQTKICFIGHTHIPGIFPEDLKTQKIHKANRYIINVGSVGQPRDGNWRLSFGIFDTGTWTYELVRSEYDVQSAADKIIANDLPRFLADRLFAGV